MTKNKGGKDTMRDSVSGGASLHVSKSFSASPVTKPSSAGSYTAVLQDVKQHALTYPSTLPMPDEQSAQQRQHLSGSDTSSSANSDCGAGVVDMNRPATTADDDSDTAQLDVGAEEEEAEETTGGENDDDQDQASDTEPEPE